MQVKELEFEPQVNLKRGMKNKDVRRLQEWLTFHGCGTVIDGDFGPATEAAVSKFRRDKKLPTGLTADAKVFGKLLEPMKDAFGTPTVAPTLSRTYVTVAKQHLAPHPLEIGGDNRGPWVRAYCGGLDGESFAWCAGFTSTLLAQACDAMNKPLPVVSSLWVPSIAIDAQQRNLFFRGRSASAAERLRPGALFFVPGGQPNFWSHIGIVTNLDGDTFQTVEGNTNAGGSANGFEVCSRFRQTRLHDFAVLD